MKKFKGGNPVLKVGKASIIAKKGDKSIRGGGGGVGRGESTSQTPAPTPEMNLGKCISPIEICIDLRLLGDIDCTV